MEMPGAEHQRTEEPTETEALRRKLRRSDIAFVAASLGAIAGTGSAMWAAERWKRFATEKDAQYRGMLEQSGKRAEAAQALTQEVLLTIQKATEEAEEAQRGWEECLEKRTKDQIALRSAITTIDQSTARHQECVALAQRTQQQVQACTETVQATQSLLPQTDLQMARFLQDKKLDNITQEEYAALLKLLESTDPQVELILDVHPAILDNFKEDLRRRILKRLFQNLEQYLQLQSQGKTITVVSDVDRVPYRMADDKPFLNYVHATIYVDGKKTPIWIAMKFHRKVGHLMLGNQDVLRFSPRGFERTIYDIYNDFTSQEMVAKIQELLSMWTANEALRK